MKRGCEHVYNLTEPDSVVRPVQAGGDPHPLLPVPPKDLHALTTLPPIGARWHSQR